MSWERKPTLTIPFGEILTRTDRMNGTTTNTYNATGNLLTSRDALNNTTTLTYKPNGLLETVTDALNHTTTLTYDSFGRLTQIKDANNKTTNFAYDARARLTSATNALNFTTSFQYDLENRLNKITHPDLTFMTYAYDLAGRRTLMTDERDNTTSYGYDNAYRLISMTDALNHTTNYGYDLMSNLVSQTDALNQTTNYEYDDFNRLKKVIYPPSVEGATRLEERLEYDTVGNVKKRIDTANRETLFDYDTANRLIKTTDALNQITQFEYNARSQMTKVKDALNQEYIFTYDALGRQLSQTRAGTMMSYEYDAVGNRTKRTDYIGRETSYEYDVLNRLKKINYLQSFNGVPPLTPIQTANYNYDDLSRLTSAINDAGTVSFTYDNRNRMKTTTDVFGHLIEYNYDATSNRTQLKLDGAIHTNYAYDVANRLTTLTDETSQNFTFGYDIANRLISKTLPNTVTTTYNYDGMSRLTRLKHQSSTATLTDNNFSYNTANQISQIAELTNTKNFAYDNIDRLTSMNNGTANENYAFDSVGNRTSSNRSSTYGYQPFNKLTSTQTATYSYNANGNMLSKADATGFWVYGWDYENRMTTARKQNKVVRFQYDALGRRVSRLGKGVGAAAKYTYDGLDVILDDGSEGVVKYQNGLGIDDKLKMVANGQAKYFLQDHLGSTVGLADESGNMVSSAIYDSFGNSTNSLTTRYQYTGREKDDFTGLHYYRARWYDANLGRFISEDPIGFAGGDINLYGYVRNNPISFRDPSGEIIVPIIIGGVVIGGLILASPSYVNAPGPSDPTYYPDNPLILNAAGGAGCSYLLNRFAAPLISRFLSGTGDDIIELGISQGPRGRLPGPTVDPATGVPVGRFIVDPRGNAMIEPVGGSTVPAGRGGIDTHTLYPNGSNYQRLNPFGHPNNPTPHGHGHLLGTGSGMRGQGDSIDIFGNIVSWSSSAAHWRIR